MTNFSMKRNDVTLFLAGIKPALYLMGNEPEAYKELRKFPSLKNGTIGRIFFHTHEEKETFFKKAMELKSSNEERHLMGTTLGYPPKAVEYFSNGHFHDFLHSGKHTGIHYHGISFACHVDDVQENIRWMKEHYDIPVRYKTSIHISYALGTDKQDTQSAV